MNSALFNCADYLKALNKLQSFTLGILESNTIVSSQIIKNDNGYSVIILYYPD